MPNLARILVIAKYKAPVRAIPAAKVIGKLIPFRNIQGMSKNIGKDGKTYQKVPDAWDAILETSTFSPYIQHIPRTETKGKDAIKLARRGNFFDISETATMIRAVTKSLTRYQIIRVDGSVVVFLD